MDSEIKKEFGELIKLIHSKPEIPDINPRSNTIYFSNSALGFLILDDESSSKYLQLLTKIFKKTVKSEDISQQYIQKQFDSAVLMAVDQNKLSIQPIEIRIQSSFEVFANSLKTKKTKYKFYYPVFGLHTEGLPLKIGNIQFEVFNQNTLLDLELPPNETDPDNIRQFKESEIIRLKKDGIIGSPYAIITVDAIDKEAAQNIATKNLKKLIEILNYFVSFIPFPNGFIFLPGDSQRMVVFDPIKAIDQKKEIFLSREVKGPLSLISFQMIIDTERKNNIGFNNTIGILEKSKSKLECLKINSIRWAGKAFVQERLGKREDAFLSYIIALDSIILPAKYPELHYRFKIRLTHLVSLEKTNRSEIAKTIDDLYDIRSKIVHSGNFEITNTDINNIRLITQRALTRLLIDEPFNYMVEIKELETWFENQILG
jgi:hypothetical protein